MKGQLRVSSPEDYIVAVDPARRDDIAELDHIIRKNAPKLEPCILSGILGYGPYHYKYASGREGDTCKIGIASNKQYISLYIMAADETGSLAKKFEKDFPKAKIGVCCVRFRKLSDLDPKPLAAMIKAAAKWNPKAN